MFWRDEVNHFPRENFVERSVRLHALLSLGSSLARVKKYAEAMACFQQAAEVVPESHETYFHMGAVSRRTGNREQAIKYLRKADSLRPGNSLIRRELEWALAGQ